MIHTEVFQRFAEDSPVSVMTQALLENVLSPTTVNSLFEQHSESQYTREVLCVAGDLGGDPVHHEAASPSTQTVNSRLTFLLPIATKPA